MMMTYKKRIVSNYKGLIDEWKVALILSIAEKRGISEDQWEDVVQELVLVVKNFKYNPNLAASEVTMLASIIEHRIVDMVREKRRNQEKIDKFQELREANIESIDSDKFTTDLPMDVLAVIEQLTPKEKKVCILLMEGKPIPFIAKQLHDTWYSVKQIIRHIRHEFAIHNLGQYLGGRNNE
jgi:RNA polymerase sigma factor (sigma-70 family)